MNEVIIRNIKPDEIHLLKNFLYEAIFQRDEDNFLPRNVVEQPELSVYVKDWGKPDDLCVVAEVGGKIVGAAWTRILDGEVKGFGYVDSQTPEWAISLYKEYRGLGIGTLLMRELIERLKARGYKQTSLAVQKDNYARRLYENMGFKIAAELQEEYLMILDLKRA